MTLAVVFWLVILVVLVIAAVAAGIMLATGNKPLGSDDVTPTSPPAGPGAEGMGVAGPGDITPGAVHERDESEAN